MEVVGPHGWRLGRIENVLLDKNTWKITQVEVKLEKEVAEGLHMKHRFKSTFLPVGVERITGVGNVVSINYTQSDVDNLIASQD